MIAQLTASDKLHMTRIDSRIDWNNTRTKTNTYPCCYKLKAITVFQNIDSSLFVIWEKWFI